MSKKQQKKQAAPKAPQGLLGRMESFFDRKEKLIFFILMGVSVLVSLLLFDAKISIGGDDSAYIERATWFLEDGKYPYYQGPLYPLFLSVFISMFGVKLMVLKFASLVCYNLHVWLTWLTFRKRIPSSLLVALLAFISINSFMQYYSSQTYTEGFFLFLQSVCIYLTVRIIDINDENKELGWVEGFKKHYKLFLVTGFAFLLLSLSKSIAIICIVPVLLFFVLYRNFKFPVYLLSCFVTLRVIYTTIVTSIYSSNDSGQFEQILRKDLYKPELGHEDLAGLVERFLNNFNTYLSLHTWRIFHFRPEDTSVIIPGLAFFTFAALVVFILISIRKNKYIFFCSLYAVVLCSAIFGGIQANNMQDRLIIIAIPFILLLFLYGFYRLAQRGGGTTLLYIGTGSLILLFSAFNTFKKAGANTTALKKNLAGDVYYGYTPDWENYLRLSKWCADSLPSNAYVAVRKSSMSFIVSGGKKFHGVYTVFSQDPDSVMANFKKAGVTHVIVASLRRNPKKNDGTVINTFQRLLYPVAERNPNSMRMIKRMGTVEPAELFELRYDLPPIKAVPGR